MHESVDDQIDRTLVRFVVLTRSRSGSGLLLSVMRSHPKIRVSHEVLKRLGDRKFEDILSEVYSAGLPEQQALGFKYFYYHPLDGCNEQVWKHLLEMQDLCVIHLIRRNILRTLVSKAIAAKSNRWSEVDAGGPDLTERQIRLTAAQLERGFRNTCRWELRSQALFRNKPMLTIYYEDLASDTDGTFRKVTDFLNVEPAKPRTRYRRQNPEPVSDLLINFEELRQHFSTTVWSIYFDERPEFPV